MASAGFRRPLSGAIFSPGGYELGIAQPGKWSPITVLASVQPPTAAQQKARLAALPEGRRPSEAIRLYTDSDLPVAGGPDGRSTRVNWRGNEYELIEVEPWLNGVLSHFLYLAERVTPAEVFHGPK